DADDEARLLRVVLGELKHHLVFGKGLVLQRDLLRAEGRCRQPQRDGRSAQTGCGAFHSLLAIPGLSSTPFSVTPEPCRFGGLPARTCFATTSHTGAPFCSLTEAQPATL